MQNVVAYGAYFLACLLALLAAARWICRNDPALRDSLTPPPKHPEDRESSAPKD
ncbi:hypothetical protein LMG23992_00809 [Cupriavidus laharis]|uniref:CcoQ/FixQ family Cbb3-type cytochrome c oxidase assembly chaperone n=1 Tax=Cupriavidus laharis TaxID=151654 RepID=A0ABM8WJH8_9BURK|nr:hypothetical protein [Cupriavidus laharis]CAG9167436.1 hypothetical protein LMG23992_00809 [Cupriavidus laharis]